uniref:RsmB/NOP family class I SAM-dependent RNA methyltransferase n=1 Tax=Vaginimicrobium propionicum TaxID=1871034 RepID=UPI000970425B
MWKKIDLVNRQIDLARLVAYNTLEAINGQGAFANIALNRELKESGLRGKDAGFVTELVSGTCRMQGSYDEIISFVTRRDLYDLQPEVVDVLRLACHQVFAMRVPMHACVTTSVDLAGVVVGEKVTGLVNAVVRKLTRKPFDAWIDLISSHFDEKDKLGIRYGHPRWIVEAISSALKSNEQELERALEANNKPASVMLVARPGLATQENLLAAGGKPAKYSDWGASRPGNPADLRMVRIGRAGVQDEGSQLVIKAATAMPLPEGDWLDLCAGPGGKAALLRGLAPGLLLANEVSYHRAKLVTKGLRSYPDRWQVMVADGTKPAWGQQAFALVVADVPCSGLGSLRRRPESRWRRSPQDVKELSVLQRDLLSSALTSVKPQGVVAYITCSPHPAETVEIVADLPKGYTLIDAPALIPNVPNASSRLNSSCIQLWPHIHETDAMFCALIRRDK